MFEIYQIQYFKIIIGIIVFALHSVVYQFILTSQPSLHFCVPALARPTGRGSGGSMSLSDITPMVHNPIAQSKPTTKVSIIY
jgi:hypothetical protein